MWLQVIIFPESTTVSLALRFEQTRLANAIARSCIKIVNFICLCVRFFCGFIYLAVSLDTFDGRSIFGSHVCFFSRQLVSSTSIINSNESINCKGWIQTCCWQWWWSLEAFYLGRQSDQETTGNTTIQPLWWQWVWKNKKWKFSEKIKENETEDEE